ncbi:preprotein translocase subunit SecY [Candidatus Karelsulcia muelleri]|uniref:preprotein translocase subunit SecY n=1 Tax=Candidatus Karelsulcia muelleri TaxID=336810 RepID=UPI000D7CE19A|nr:preprotein translocase subunit SecY [Candidatus Karelsulcia muelleri]
MKLKNIFIFNKKELSSKIYYTLFIILIYRFGSFLPIPFIKPIYINEIGLKQNLLTSLTGGACNRASLFSLGIMPNISASIFIQFLCYFFTFFQKLKKNGPLGKRKLNLMTKGITLILSLIQANAYILYLINIFLKKKTYYLNFILIYGKSFFLFPSIICLTTGTFLTMWLKEKINEKGLGNSFLIISGILSRFINYFISEILNRINENVFLGILILLFEIIVWILIIGIAIILIKSVRKISIHYINNFGFKRNYSSNLEEIKFLPLKVVHTGVMPIMCSQGMLFFLITLMSKIHYNSIYREIIIEKFKNIYGLWYNILYSIIIILITFFYTYFSISVNTISDDLKLNGGYIPNVKPGKETSLFLKTIVSQISLIGSLLLTIMALLPSIFVCLGGEKKFALFFGGSSLIILVGSLLEIKTTINSYLLNYN